MEMTLIEKDKTSIKVELLEVDEATIQLIIQELLADKKVSTASYSMGHPQLDRPAIYVKVTDGKPQTALKRAAKQLANTFKDINTLFETATS